LDGIVKYPVELRGSFCIVIFRYHHSYHVNSILLVDITQSEKFNVLHILPVDSRPVVLGSETSSRRVRPRKFLFRPERFGTESNVLFKR